MPGVQGPTTVNGAESDPNYVSRLGLGPVANVWRWEAGKNYSYVSAVS